MRTDKCLISEVHNTPILYDNYWTLMISVSGIKYCI